ncbi:ATP-binding protein [Gammaproteobacteria bacterium AB-CW1]|uniref:histidine kinase n=1 Tax=Natronospira elongata TaxID=3110268 RepID=A0AAP6JFM0_9GAMM|nr:ATP-binding protein [Gammaproteobacteria bacterium AB-CW1]
MSEHKPQPARPHPDTRAPRVRIRWARFPWPSALGALFTVAYFLFYASPELVAGYALPTDWFGETMALTVAGIFALLLVFDLRRFQHRFALQKQDVARLNEQLDTAWQRIRELQLKAHTYSGHADKLKLFISDKLLEYIEYDEKFLHFKSIAREVRHNGVISFDKVQTALQQAAEQARRQQGETNTAGKQDTAGPQDPAADYQAALDAMRYLWDLLDLSTADNLALHIGNLLCECEEHYYQQELDAEAADVLPFEPTYDPRLAAWRAMSLVRPDPPPRPEGNEVYRLEDGDWYVALEPVGVLLGNENHLVLLLDNLLKNAQYFSRKRRGKSGAPTIAFQLEEIDDQAVFRVYNRGPQISEDDHARLFQLGYSTRRSREHHGRGLGLYFVNEIVKGYEGRIEVNNIHTPETEYELRLHLDNDEVLTKAVTVECSEGGRPRCLPQSESEQGTEAETESAPKQQWTLPAPIQRIEIAGSRDGETQVLEGFENRGKQTRQDPQHPDRPHWWITYQAKRKQPTLSFEPLDLTGVEFRIQLPTAYHRLESSQAEVDENLDAEMEQLGERFSRPLD